MSKKEYIFTETGEKRCPKEGEYFYNNTLNIVEYSFIDFTKQKGKILKLEIRKAKGKKHNLKLKQN